MAQSDTDSGQQKNTQFSLLLVPDIGGGTRYQSDDYLIGLAEYVGKLKSKPNMVIIQGGLSPFVPPTGTVKYRDSLLSLREGIENTNDAAAIIKIPTERLLSRLPSSTTVVYTLSRSDEKNIGIIADRLVNEANTNQHMLVRRVIDAELAIRSRDSIIKGAEEMKEVLQRAEESATTKKDLANVQAKIRLNKEEMTEFRERREALAELYQLSIEKFTETKAQSERAKVEKEIAKVPDMALHEKLMDEFYAPLISHVRSEKIIKELEKIEAERAALTERIERYLKKQNGGPKAAEGKDSTDGNQGEELARGERGRFVGKNSALHEAESDANEEVSSPEVMAELQKRAKLLGNKARILNLRKEERTEQVSIQESAEKIMPALIYTKNLPLTAKQEAVINKIALSTHLSVLKYTTGRKRNIVIQMESLHVYPVKASNGSGVTVVTGQEAVDPVLNVIVASTLDNITKVYKKQTNTEAPTRLARMVENAVGLKVLDRTETNFFTTSGNMYSSVALDPVRDWSSSLMISNPTGTLWSLKALSDLGSGNALGQRIRTEETKALEKGLLDSSVSLWRYDLKTKAIEHEVLTPQFLEDRRRERDVTVEKQAISKMLREKNGNGELPAGIKTDLELARISGMTPSELKEKPRELSILRRDRDFEGKLRSMAPYADEPLPEQPKTLKMALFGDVHFGNKMKHDLILAGVKDALERKPDIVVFNGDIIEGNMANFKNVSRTIDLPEHAGDYEESLRKKGMTEAQVQREMLRYRKARDESAPIQNINAQTSLFNEAFMPLIDDVMKRGGIVIVVAGNHYNETTKRWEYDESSEMYYAIRNHMKAHEEDGVPLGNWKERLKPIMGSEFGAGDLNIEGLQTHFAHKLEDKEDKMESFLETKRTDASFILVSHFHKHKEVKTAGKLVIETLPMKDTILDPYLTRIPTVAHIVDGYVYMEAQVRNGDIVGYKTKPIIERELKLRGLQPEDPHLDFVQQQQVVNLERPTPQKVRR